MLLKKYRQKEEETTIKDDHNEKTLKIEIVKKLQKVY